MSNTIEEKIEFIDDFLAHQLEDFTKHLQNKYGVLLGQYTETIVERYLSDYLQSKLKNKMSNTIEEEIDKLQELADNDFG